MASEATRGEAIGRVQRGRRSLLAVAVQKAQHWLVEPAERGSATACPPPAKRPIVAVIGLARRCGTTTIARALAGALAARDVNACAAVSTSDKIALVPLGTPSANRMARAIGDPPGGRVRSAGRLCLLESEDHLWIADTARPLAPVVFDIGNGAAPACPASLADHVVLVASPEVEPALAAVVAASLARVGPEPLIVVNRVREPGHWADRPVMLVPDSRIAARLALTGCEPSRALNAVIAELADLCAHS